MKRVLVSFVAVVAVLAGATSLSVEANAASRTEFSVSGKPKAETKTVTFQSDIHCKNCAKKVEENISFEKGVKGLEVSVEKKTIKITYDASKTSVEQLAAAIKKLGYSAKVI